VSGEFQITNNQQPIHKMHILITGGAGFIGSNLIDYFLEHGHKIVCLDDLSTGYEKNIEHNYSNPNFRFIKGDIRDLETCREAVKGCEYVCHQAAIGSVPRSLENPVYTNSVNIDGFLNMLIAARDEKVKRFVYAASSSTYGDSPKLPKVEDEIGKPLSPYAITKYVNELYADVFAKQFGMQCIGLRYFNVFGRRQDPNGAYAAVIPKWVNLLINHKSPVINGDGTYSRDFTFIVNVMEANEKALFTEDLKIIRGLIAYRNIDLDENKYRIKGYDSRPKLDYIQEGNKYYFSEVFNIAFGQQTSLSDLFSILRDNLKKFDKDISKILPKYDKPRAGDIPHSQASILKALTVIGYQPLFSAEMGLISAIEWYYNNARKL